MVVPGKGHGDAHPCIPQMCTESSLSPLLRGTRRVCSSFSHPHDVFTKKVTTKKGDAWVKTWVVVVVAVVGDAIFTHVSGHMQNSSHAAV